MMCASAETMTLPEPANPEEKANPKVVGYWRLRGALSLAIGLLSVACVALPASFLPGMWWLGPAIVLLGLCWLGGLLVLSQKRYEQLSFQVDDERLVLQDGVLFRQQQVIPISRMQHVDIEHGPLQRMFGITSLAVFTAGGMAATVRIPGLTPERAAELRQHVLARRDGAS